MRSRSTIAFAIVLGASLGSAALALLISRSTGDSSLADLHSSDALVFAGSALLFSVIATVALMRLTDRQIDGLRSSLREALQGNYRSSATKHLASSDEELRALARDFDSMAARVHGQLASRSRLLRNLSDELRAPLSRLQAISSLMRQHPDQDHTLATQMDQELDALHELVAEVLTYSQLETRGNLKRQRTNLTDMARTIGEDAARKGASKNIEVALASDNDVMLDVEHGLIYSAMDNLVHHALKRSRDNGAIDIAVSGTSGAARITLCHRGRPISDAATLDHLFEPFGTTADAGGIGLAIARRAILLHGGTIEAGNTPDGLLVTVNLPD